MNSGSICERGSGISSSAVLGSDLARIPITQTAREGRGSTSSSARWYSVDPRSSACPSIRTRSVGSPGAPVVQRPGSCSHRDIRFVAVVGRSRPQAEGEPEWWLAGNAHRCGDLGVRGRTRCELEVRSSAPRRWERGVVCEEKALWEAAFIDGGALRPRIPPGLGQIGAAAPRNPWLSDQDMETIRFARDG
jgi:hypothetical protein